MGLLTDLFGGAAIASHGVLQRESKLKDEAKVRAAENEAQLARQKSLADYQADIATKKQMLLEELAAESEQRKQKDFANAADKAETRAGEIGTDRRFQKFMEDGKQAGYFEGMSPEEIKGVFNETYNDKRVSAETGGDRYQDKTLAVKADDYVKASRETGNSGLLTQALNDRKTAIGQDKSNVENALKERKLNQDAINADRKDELGWARIEALVNGKAGGKSTEIRDTLNLIDSKRKTIASEEDNIIRMMQNAYRPSEKIPLQKRLDDLATERGELKEMQRALTVRLSGSEPAKDAPKGRSYEGVNDDGSVRYGPASGNAPPKTSGRGDPSPGSGVVRSGEQSDSAKLKELEAQFSALMSQQSNSKTASQANADVLQGLQTQIQRLKSTEASGGKPIDGQSNRIVSIKKVG